jgi:hypothetical protein
MAAGSPSDWSRLGANDSESEQLQASRLSDWLNSNEISQPTTDLSLRSMFPDSAPQEVSLSVSGSGPSSMQGKFVL